MTMNKTEVVILGTGASMCAGAPSLNAVLGQIKNLIWSTTYQEEVYTDTRVHAGIVSVLCDVIGVKDNAAAADAPTGIEVLLDELERIHRESRYSSHWPDLVSGCDSIFKGTDLQRIWENQKRPLLHPDHPLGCTHNLMLMAADAIDFVIRKPIRLNKIARETVGGYIAMKMRSISVDDRLIVATLNYDPVFDYLLLRSFPAAPRR